MKTTIIAISLLLAGCLEPPLDEKFIESEPETEEAIDNNGLAFPEVLVVDGCEYIIIKEKKGSGRDSLSRTQIVLLLD